MLNPEQSKIEADKTRKAMKMADDREITCQTCQDNDKCEYAFDPYNTQGDCLAMK